MKLLLTVTVLSMFATPFLNELGAKVASRLEKAKGGLMLDTKGDSADGDFVLVCGFGRVGQAVCELLTARLVRYKAFDMDPYRVAEARDRGLPVYYGDARRPDVLDVFMREGVNKVDAVVVTLDSERDCTKALPRPFLDTSSTLPRHFLDSERDCTKAVRALRRQYPTADKLPIFVRAVDEKHRRTLAREGATALETGPQESALTLGFAYLRTPSHAFARLRRRAR